MCATALCADFAFRARAPATPAAPTAPIFAAVKPRAPGREQNMVIRIKSDEPTEVSHYQGITELSNQLTSVTGYNNLLLNFLSLFVFISQISI